MKKILSILAVIFCVLSLASCEKEINFTESIVGTTWAAETINGSLVFEFVSPTTIHAYFLSENGDTSGETDGTYTIYEEKDKGFISISSLKVKYGKYYVYDFAHCVSKVFEHTSSNGDYFRIDCKWGLSFPDDETTLLFFKK